MIKMTPSEVEHITSYIQNISGISIDPSQSAFLENRLYRLLQEFALRSYDGLYRKALADGGKTLEKRVIDAVATQETLFFRDKTPFLALQNKILPSLIEKRTPKVTKLPTAIRIWSAACSTGQEAYSIAMIVHELAQIHKDCKFSVVATDLSEAAITKAKTGRYCELEIDRGLPVDKLKRYFYETKGEWQIKREIRKRVVFKRHNLLKPFTETFHKFDVIFCRNALIYFNLQDKIRLIKHLIDSLESDGYLFIGASESLKGVTSRLTVRKELSAVYYQLNSNETKP
jgi:chemotaxis protein methyltransferase CheR